MSYSLSRKAMHIAITLVSILGALLVLQVLGMARIPQFIFLLLGLMAAASIAVTLITSPLEPRRKAVYALVLSMVAAVLLLPRLKQYALILPAVTILAIIAYLSTTPYEEKK